KMRLILVVLCLVTVCHSFYLSNYYYAPPSNSWDSGMQLQREEPELSVDSNSQFAPKAKRLKPCFYSPIQCMYRRK
ncbi:hypothetical protein PFISCL1PPCAC_16158, partial [Pristionchus fissidentatus]